MRGSTSYVTGQHNVKAGFDMLLTRRYVDYRERGAIGLPVSYRFNNGVPNRLTQYTTPLINPAFVRPSLGIFAAGSVDPAAADGERRPALRVPARLFGRD